MGDAARLSLGLPSVRFHAFLPAVARRPLIRRSPIPLGCHNLGLAQYGAQMVSITEGYSNGPSQLYVPGTFCRLLHGERPYWFIHESANFTKASKTYLAQTPVTCEAGPGSPSGHVMANVILFVVICDAVDAYFIRSRLKILRRE